MSGKSINAPVSGSIRVVVNMQVQPGHEQEFEDAWAPICEACRQEPGNRQYELFRSVAHPEQYTLLELWRDEETYDAHWAKELGRQNPTFAFVDSGERRSGEGGAEFHVGHRYFRPVDGRWEPAPDGG